MPDAEDTTIRVPQLPVLNGGPWKVACSRHEVRAPLSQFLEITNLLLEQVQLNSTHLFRADILQDTTGKVETLAEKEARCQTVSQAGAPYTPVENAEEGPATKIARSPSFTGFELRRTVVRRLIPRKPQLDKPLDQSCFIYHSTASDTHTQEQALVVYSPHYTSSDTMPWYHPKVQGLAYLYTTSSTSGISESISATISIHYSPFPDTPAPLPERLSRTFQSLLKTMIRLLKLPSKNQPSNQQPSSSSQSISNSNTSSLATDIATMSLSAASLKDTILPQHTVQNTYTRLKQVYAADLISRWIEKTEPSKHVFEDLSIAAFLIELWTNMYGSRVRFNEVAGFVDIACGNGVLVYILIREGWHGSGFDARRRKTWDILGPEVKGCLHEKVCIPWPFAKGTEAGEFEKVAVHDGTFAPGTFIISNHADELTCWTPILAARPGSERPLPFLAIPCCSHALDGSRRRYTQKEVAISVSSADNGASRDGKSKEEDEQSVAGDLKAMRAAKQKANNHADDKSMYACLTRKTAALAQELDMDVELTLMRIPSTRNIGVVGNRKSIYKADNEKRELTTSMNGLAPRADTEEVAEKIRDLLERECASTGGVDNSARTWIEKAKKLHGGQGRGKVNLHGPVESVPSKCVS